MIKLQLLEKHFGAALSESGMNHFDIAKQHAATVIAALNAIHAYAEWAPVPDLAKCGIIHGYAIMAHGIYVMMLCLIFLFMT